MIELEEGIMRVIAGPEKKTRLLSEHERLITAYHEMGHALVGHFLPNCDPVHKVSIISRGQALGYTISLPQEDKFLTTRTSLMDTLAMTLGGRAAEELVFDEVTTGAANDLEKVTGTAKNMIMRYGMSEKLGPRTLGHRQDQPFLGRDIRARRRLLAGDRARDRRRDPPHHRGRPRARPPGAGGAHGRAAPHLEDPAGARDDRPRSSSCACSTARARKTSGRRRRGAGGEPVAERPRQESKPRGLGLPLPSPRPPETPPAQA